MRHSVTKSDASGWLIQKEVRITTDKYTAHKLALHTVAVPWFTQLIPKGN
jgi:hypothetical protein